MQNLRDKVRAKVDEMRMAGVPRTVDQNALISAIASQTSAGTGDREDHGTIHMCPWHTCQATRHG